MADYKGMYLHLARETERAVQILIAAQQKCEELYVNAPEPELLVLDSGSVPNGTGTQNVRGKPHS